MQLSGRAISLGALVLVLGTGLVLLVAKGSGGEDSALTPGSSRTGVERPQRATEDLGVVSDVAVLAGSSNRVGADVALQDRPAASSQAPEAPAAVIVRSGRVLWTEGKFDEAISQWRKDTITYEDPVRRAAMGDRVVIAVLAQGSPRDAASAVNAMIAALCESSMDQDHNEWVAARYSAWHESAAAWPGGQLMQRLTDAGEGLGLGLGGVPATRDWFMARLKSRLEELPDADRPELQATIDFLDISTAYWPAISSTPDSTAQKILPRVKEMLEKYAGSESPNVRTMCRWLRVRYRALL